MDNRTPLVYGLTGQTLEMYPMEGVPSAAATYSIWRGQDSNDATALFTGTATRDSTSQTITSASGYSQANRRKLNMTATTGLTVGRRYVVANALGQYENATVTAVSADVYAETSRDLAYDYAAAETSTVKGFRQSFTIDPDFIADTSRLNDEAYPYRVLWTYTVAGVVRKHWTYFDVVRGAWQHGVTIADLAAYWADVNYQGDRDDYGDQARKKIEAASQRVQMDLKNRGIDPNTVADGPVRDELVRNQVFCLYAREGKAPGGREPEAFRREMTAIYMRDLEAAVSSGSLKMSQDKTGAVTAEPWRNLWLRS